MLYSIRGDKDIKRVAIAIKTLRMKILSSEF